MGIDGRGAWKVCIAEKEGSKMVDVEVGEDL